MDDLKNKFEEHLPEDEYIRDVAIRSRNIEQVSSLLVMITTVLADLKDIKNGPIYRRKVVLRSYETMLKERYRYLRISRNRKNKDRENAKLRQEKLNEVIADKLIKTTLKQQRVSNAQKAMADLLEARDTIYQSFNQNVEKTKAVKDMEEKVNIFISRGYTPDEALRKAIKGDLVTDNNLTAKLISKPEIDLNEDLSDLTNVDVSDLSEDYSFEDFVEKQKRRDEEILGQEPITKQHPIKLDQEPKIKEGDSSDS